MRKGSHHSAKARAKMSAANKGKPKSPEHCTAIAAAQVGRKASDEARANMSAAQKGKPKSPEHCAAIAAAKKGKPRSPEHCAAISAAKMGHEVSEETRDKIAAAQSGPNNPNWLGGISREPYAWTFNEELKEEVRRRDGYVCQLCGVPQAECKKKLTAHHIDYDKRNSDPVNLIAVCVSCNSRVNANREYWTAYFQNFVLDRDVRHKNGKLPNAP